MADRTISYVFRADLRSLQSGLAAGSRSVRDLSGRLTALDRDGARMRAGLNDMGNTAGKAGLLAAAGLGAFVKKAADFDQAMSNVQAATHETAGNMELLRKAALKAGADTVFSATEAAGAIEALSKAGVSTQDILAGGLTGALNLAAAGSLDVSQAAEIAATTLTQFGLKGDQTSHVADLLAAAAGKAQGEVTDMSEALKYVGPVAAQMGISLEETTGVIAELASQGILGSQAGTSLRGMLTSLTSPSKLATNTMEGLGISMYDAQGHFVGLDGIAGQLKSTMSGLTEAERDQALGRIFGNEQITAARILYAGGADAVADWTKQVDDSGYAAETASLKMDNLKGDLEQLGGSLETALIKGGSGSQGPLRSLTQGATDLVNSFNNMPGPIQTATSGILALVAVTGGAAFFGSRVVSGIASTNAALAELGTTARITSGSLATAAKSAGLFAAAYVATDLVSSGLDDVSRHGDAATASMRNLADIQKSLGASNLGKYADQLGIDLERLSQDLDENGRKGEYVNEVATKLGSEGGGFKALYDGVVPMNEQLGRFGIHLADNAQEANEAGVAFEQLLGRYDKTHQASDGLTGSVSGLDLATFGLGETAFQTAEQVQAAAKAQADAAKAADETARSFTAFGDSLNDSKVSLSGWIADMEKQAAALRDFTRNSREAADNGVRKGLIRALQEVGPEGAMRLQQLADASEHEVGRANKAFKSSEDAVHRYTKAIAGVPPAVATNISVNGVGPAIDSVSALARLVNGLHDRDINIRVHKSTNANLAEASIAGGFEKRAAGGHLHAPGAPVLDLPDHLTDHPIDDLTGTAVYDLEDVAA